MGNGMNRSTYDGRDDNISINGDRGGLSSATPSRDFHSNKETNHGKHPLRSKRVEERANYYNFIAEHCELIKPDSAKIMGEYAIRSSRKGKLAGRRCRTRMQAVLRQYKQAKVMRPLTTEALPQEQGYRRTLQELDPRNTLVDPGLRDTVAELVRRHDHNQIGTQVLSTV